MANRAIINRAIINKHIDSLEDVNLLDLFVGDPEMAKGEIIVLNDPDSPSIYILDTNGIPRAVVGGDGSNGGEGGNGGDLTALQQMVADHDGEIKELQGTVSTHTASINEINEKLKELEDETGPVVSIDVDAELSETSENPVQNKAITKAILDNEEAVASALNKLNSRVATLEGSQGPSGDIPTKLSQLENDTKFITIDEVPVPVVDTVLSKDSENPISNKAVAEVILDNEKTIAASLTDLDSRLLTLEAEADPKTYYVVDLAKVGDEEKGPEIYAEASKAYNEGKMILLRGAEDPFSLINPTEIVKGEDGSYVFTVSGTYCTEDSTDFSTAHYSLTATGLTLIDTFPMQLLTLKKEEGEALAYLADDGQYHSIEVGANITVDTALDAESVNPVQNKTITGEINGVKSRVGTLETTVSNHTGSLATISGDISTLKTTTGNLNATVSAHTASIASLNENVGEVDGKISTAVDTAKKVIDAYTVNGLPISANPVLDSKNVFVETGYTTTDVIAEPVAPGDTLSKAFGKLQKSLDSSNLVFSAAINDLNEANSFFRCPFLNGEGWEPSLPEGFDTQAFYESAVNAYNKNRIFVLTGEDKASYIIADHVSKQEESLTILAIHNEVNESVTAIGSFLCTVTPTSVEFTPYVTNFIKNGNGTKFLADNGEYITVNVDSEPVSLDYGVQYYEGDGEVNVANVASRTHHVFTGALTSLTVTLGPGGKIGGEEYIIEFDTTDVIPTVSIAYPNFQVIWPTTAGITYEPNMHYIVSVQRGYGMVQSFEAVDRRPQDVE